MVPAAWIRARQATGRAVRAGLGRAGYDLVRRDADPEWPYDYDDDAKALFQRVRPYTLTSHERILDLRQTVRHLVDAGVPGAFVECGVWKGGSMLAAALTLLDRGAADRDLWLYDTYELMPPPTDRDRDVWGQQVSDFYEDFLANPFYANVPETAVEALLVGAGYPREHLRIVKGMVEDTVPAQAPEQIALLRLDTDFYESTRHELAHLLPRVVVGGVVIVDDYGHFMGSKDATDECLAAAGVPTLLHRIDWTGRSFVMTAELREALSA